MIKTINLLLMSEKSDQPKTISSKLYNKLLQTPRKFAHITGMEIPEFQSIIKKLQPSWKKIQSKKKCHGRASKIATLEERLMVLLMRYRANLAYTILGLVIDVDTSNVYRILVQLETLLAKKINIQQDSTITYDEILKFINK